MGVCPSGGRGGRGGIIGVGDLCLPRPEQIYTVHCDQAYYGPVSGGGAETGIKGGQEVVAA